MFMFSNKEKQKSWKMIFNVYCYEVTINTESFWNRNHYFKYTGLQYGIVSYNLKYCENYRHVILHLV